MLYRNFFLSFAGLLLLVATISTAKDHTLNGKLKLKSGETFDYSIVFSVNKSSLKGYSITKLPDGTQNKTAISGTFNGAQHLIIFSETKMLSTPQKDATFCFVNAVLLFKKKGNNIICAGPFSGKDSKKKPCGNGNLEFTIDANSDSLFNKDIHTPVKMESSGISPKTVTMPNKYEEAMGADKITAGVDKEFTWHSDTCVIDVWDGGVIDGDVISVYFDEVKVLDNYKLVHDAKQLRIPFTKRVSTITIVAEDEGVNPPNTAQIMLTDRGSKPQVITAFNKKGARAKIVIKRSR